MDLGENSDSDSDMGVDETSVTPMEVHNTQASSVERTGRGAVQCKRITKIREGELLNVQYNEHGQRIREDRKDLASYSGLLAESQISIVDYENWHVVGDEVRDLLWDTIKAKFNLTEDEKKGVVSDIGEKWKEFKSWLTRARWGMDGRKFASSLTASLYALLNLNLNLNMCSLHPRGLTIRLSSFSLLAYL
ncbi:hypothetical protein IFM89_012600 [Coptis chinensis]|uniref:Uncharacterized protein n=1 Tax=Coptis chinensis TaxID=261450 RepID=A0A835M5H7_9MAGN|nr:hypothetical protein IFM89_012600 [Coptis chinensis]